MKYLVYRCVDCDHEEISKDMDGRRCNKCSGCIRPIREATNEEVRIHQDKRWRAKAEAKDKVLSFMNVACRLGMQLMEKEEQSELEQEFLKALDEVVDIQLGLKS